MSSEPITSVFNDGYIAEAYESYRRDPSSVDESWRQFFRFAEGISGVTGSAAQASGTADAAGCVSNDPNKPCNTAAMPPGGKTMTDAELEILRKWIADGANDP